MQWAGDGDHGRGMVWFAGTEGGQGGRHPRPRAAGGGTALSSGGCRRGLGSQSGRHIRGAVGAQRCPRRAAGFGDRGTPTDVDVADALRARP